MTVCPIGHTIDIFGSVLCLCNILNKNTVDMQERHLIECKTQDAFKMSKEALVDYTGVKIALNNHDGTSDFIVVCTPEYASKLREKGLTVIKDCPFKTDLGVINATRESLDARDSRGSRDFCD
jgi:hypothetical protein